MRVRTLIQLPAPRYSVELIDEGGKHNYLVKWADEDAIAVFPKEYCQAIYPGVTGRLSIIAKPALVPWARKEALKLVRDRMKLNESVLAIKPIAIVLEYIYALLNEAEKQPDKLKDDAADLGTEAHAYIDAVIRGEALQALPDEILEPVSAFASWRDQQDLEFVAGDTKTASRRHGFGGSLDALAVRRDGRLVLLDWKTSKGLYDEYALQVAAYARAFEEQYGVEIAEAWCVRFRKKGVEGPPFEALKVLDISRSFQSFLLAKNLQDEMKQPHFDRPPKIKKEKTK